MNLHRVYAARGLDARLVVGRKSTSDPTIQLMPHERTSNPWRRFWWRRHFRSLEHAPVDRQAWKRSRLAHRLAAPASIASKWMGREDFSYPGVWQLFELWPQAPDVVHAHNLHGDYFDLRALPWLSRTVPLVLTLHDAWLLSGHCTHSLSCERWKSGCGRCPDLTLPAPVLRDATAYNWRRKRDIFARSRLFVAAPSRWLMRKIEESMLVAGIAETRVIPNGTNLRTFHPGPRAASRARLGLSEDAVVLLLASQDVQGNVWRDFDMFRDAVSRLAEDERLGHVVALALGGRAKFERIGRGELRSLPFESRAETVADYYRAADLYVHTAKADTFPNVVIEAQACGCPVIATAIGGIPEQIEDGVTGVLVAAGDAAGLARRIADVLHDPDFRQRMGQAAAVRATRLYDLETQAAAYLAWYAEISCRIH